MLSLSLSVLTLRPNMVFDMDIFKRIINFYFCSWATGLQYGPIHHRSMGCSAAPLLIDEAVFHMGGPPTFF